MSRTFQRATDAALEADRALRSPVTRTNARNVLPARDRSRRGAPALDPGRGPAGGGSGDAVAAQGGPGRGGGARRRRRSGAASCASSANAMGAPPSATAPTTARVTRRTTERRRRDGDGMRRACGRGARRADPSRGVSPTGRRAFRSAGPNRSASGSEEPEADDGRASSDLDLLRAADRRRLDLGDRLGDLDAARARLGAVEGRAAAPHALLVVEDVEAHLRRRRRGESKMKRCALTIAAGPKYWPSVQNTGHDEVHAAQRMHLVVSSKRRAVGDRLDALLALLGRRAGDCRNGCTSR